MARHKRPWCRFCHKRKARAPYEEEGFCSQQCALIVALGAWGAMREGAGGDDWCVRCGHWSGDGHHWVGAQGMTVIDPIWSDHCQCPVPIPSETGEPYIREEHDD